MWSPTHVQVTVHRAKGLLTKGKNGTNNCFVTIALGKEKYITSVRDKASQNVEWHEECELAIPEKGNTAELILTCLHHNNLGIDEFLGQVSLPLRDMDAYDRPRSKWFKLLSKPGQEKKDKERGELEVRINFTVKAGSLTDLSKKEKHKSSFNQLASSVGGSLLSIGTLEKKKGLKKFATSIGSKLHLSGKKKDKKDSGDTESFTGSINSIGTPNSSLGGSRKWNGKNYLGNTDPGVAEDAESNFDKISQRSSNSSMSYVQDYNNDMEYRSQPTIQNPQLLQNNAINNRFSTPEIKITHDINKSSTESDSKIPSNTNQLDSKKTNSFKKRFWGKPRLPPPIPESYTPKDENYDNQNTEVILRVKDEPIPNESRMSQISEIHETDKPEPRQFILNKDEGNDNLSLGNLSCNSSPYSSITSQSYYDYNPKIDSQRTSIILDEANEENSNLYASFNRADSRRRASRKMHNKPQTVEREIEEKPYEEVKFEESPTSEINIDFQPQENNLKMENKIEIKLEQDIPKNALEYFENDIIKPEPKIRKIKQIENTIVSPIYKHAKEENIAVECRIAEKMEKTKSFNVALLNNKSQIFETRREEKMDLKSNIVEIEEVSPTLTADVKYLPDISETNSYLNTVIEKYPYFVKENNKVSNITIQLGNLSNEENMEIVGAKSNSNLKATDIKEENIISDYDYVPELRKSTEKTNFEIRDMKCESALLDETNTNKTFVSDFINRFEQISTSKNSSAISSPKPYFRQSFQNIQNFEKSNLQYDKSYSQHINLPISGALTKKDYPFEIIKSECYAIESSPIEKFNKTNVEHKAVKYNVAQELEILKKENSAIICNFAQPSENTNVQHIAVESNIAQIYEIKKEENIAIECSVAEKFENTNLEHIVMEHHIPQNLEIRKEENVVVECVVAEKFSNANLEHIVIERFIPQSLEIRKEENIVVECDVAEKFETANLEHIVMECYVPQTLEFRKEENVVVECDVLEKFENANLEHIVMECLIPQSLEIRNEENVVVECDFAEKFETANLEHIVMEGHIPQILEIRNDEHISIESDVAEPHQNAIVEHVLKESDIPQILEQSQKENIAVECRTAEVFNIANVENIATTNLIISPKPRSPDNSNYDNFKSSSNILQMVECETAQVFNIANVENIAVEQNYLEVYEKIKEEHFAENLGIIEAVEKIKKENIVVDNQIAQIYENCKEEYVAVECNVIDVSENAVRENIRQEINTAKLLENKENVNYATEVNLKEEILQIDPKNISINSNILEMNDICNKNNELQTELNNELKKTEVTKIILGEKIATNLIPSPKPRPPDNHNSNHDNLNKSSSNILQMIEYKEDYYENKEKTTTKTSNSSVEEESDYESLQSEPELQMDMTNKSNINYINRNDNEFQMTNSNIVEITDDFKKPIPRPRNPNSDTLNNLIGDSSSNCSSIENFNVLTDIPKKIGNQDPGVIEDDDEFVFDKLSHKSSGSSLNIRAHNDYNPNRVPSPVITKEEDIYRASTKISISPPAKPPRNPSDQKLDEWETKLYGNHLEVGSTDSLKRRSWGNNRIPLNTTEENEEHYEDVKLTSPNSNNLNNSTVVTTITKPNPTEVFSEIPLIQKTSDSNPNKDDKIGIIYEEKLNAIQKPIPISNEITASTDNLYKLDKKESKLEKLLNKSPILRTQSRDKLNEDQPINRSSSGKVRPKILPRSDTIAEFTNDIIRSPEDAKEIREKLKKDQKEISEKTDKIEKKNRFTKFKYFSKKADSKNDSIDEINFHGERHNPIGHENFNDNQNSLPELSQDLLNKYDGKSREDIILIADSLEKDMIIERNRVKELEEYLDNLLLRVMETHPKILQNPYRTTSTKSG